MTGPLVTPAGGHLMRGRRSSLPRGLVKNSKSEDDGSKLGPSAEPGVEPAAADHSAKPLRASEWIAFMTTAPLRIAMRLAASVAISPLILDPVASLAVAEEQAAEAALERLEIVTATGTHLFGVEVARTAHERERGLMFRRSLPQDHGMLFLFDVERSVAMWMKDTYVPLDMIFVSRKGRVVSIARNAVPLSEMIISSIVSAYGVIELAAGAADAIGLAVGDSVRHPEFDH